MVRIRVGLVLVGLLVSLEATAAPPDADRSARSEAAIARARTQSADGNYANAVKTLDAALRELEPGGTDYATLLILDQLLALDIHVDRPEAELGWTRRYVETVDSLGLGLEFRVAARVRLAQKLAEVGQPDAALQLYEQIDALDPALSGYATLEPGSSGFVTGFAVARHLMMLEQDRGQLGAVALRRWMSGLESLLGWCQADLPTRGATCVWEFDGLRGVPGEADPLGVDDQDRARVLDLRVASLELQHTLDPLDPGLEFELSRLASLAGRWRSVNHIELVDAHTRAWLAPKPDDPWLAHEVFGPALALVELGEVGKAERSGEAALAWVRAGVGPSHWQLALAYRRLATVFNQAGEQLRASQQLTLASALFGAIDPNQLSIAEARLALDVTSLPHPQLRLRVAEADLATARDATGEASRGYRDALAQLGWAHWGLGQVDRARAVWADRLAYAESDAGPDELFDALYGLIVGVSDDAEASVLVDRALTVAREHPEMVARSSFDHAAQMAWKAGDGLLLRALERGLGRDPGREAERSAAEAIIAELEGRWADAAGHWRALGNAPVGVLGWEDARGALTLALLHDPDPAVAAAALDEMVLIQEAAIATNLRQGSETEQLAYLRRAREFGERAIGLVVAHHRDAPEVTRQAFRLVIQAKGRVLDEARRNPKTAGEREVERLHARLTALQWGGGEPLDALAIEAALRDAEASAKRERVQEAAKQAPNERILAKALPEAASLIEYLRYRAPSGEARYLALAFGGDATVELVDLGPADVIDAAVSRFRSALRDPSKDPSASAVEVDRLVFSPLLQVLGSAPKQLVIGADAALNTIPFTALSDGIDLRLHHYDISYVTSARDLITFDHSTEPAGVVIVANPDFGAAPAQRAVHAGLSRSLTSVFFTALPGTAAEGEGIAAMMVAPTLLRDASARESALVDRPAPVLLHIATHGFFLPQLDSAGGREQERGLEYDGEGRKLDRSQADPMLRAGLALAGANLDPTVGSPDDGILTAAEAQWLELAGTELVVLSACETGVGDLVDGEGVAGLRRAFLLAGAQTIVTSLWKVDDQATKDLMLAYFRELARGSGRAKALRNAQREVASRPATAHPYYWASFVSTGATEPLVHREVFRPELVDPPPTAKPQRCTVETHPSPSGALWLLLVLVAARRPGRTRSDRRGRSA